MSLGFVMSGSVDVAKALVLFVPLFPEYKAVLSKQRILWFTGICHGFMDSFLIDDQKRDKWVESKK